MSKKSWIIPLIVLLAAAGLLFGIAGHWTSWQGNRSGQETDDAYLKADVTPLSTRISGTVRKVDVGDYQSVKAGQTLIELDDEDYRATLDQARAARRRFAGRDGRNLYRAADERGPARHPRRVASWRRRSFVDQYVVQRIDDVHRAVFCISWRLAWS